MQLGKFCMTASGIFYEFFVTKLREYDEGKEQVSTRGPNFTENFGSVLIGEVASPNPAFRRSDFIISSGKHTARCYKR